MQHGAQSRSINGGRAARLAPRHASTPSVSLPRRVNTRECSATFVGGRHTAGFTAAAVHRRGRRRSRPLSLALPAVEIPDVQWPLSVSVTLLLRCRVSCERRVCFNANYLPPAPSLRPLPGRRQHRGSSGSRCASPPGRGDIEENVGVLVLSHSLCRAAEIGGDGNGRSLLFVTPVL